MTMLDNHDKFSIFKVPGNPKALSFGISDHSCEQQGQHTASSLDDLYNEFSRYNVNGPPVGHDLGNYFYASPNGNTYSRKGGKWLGQTIYSHYPNNGEDPIGDAV